jgi:hypothetical protein
VEDALIQEQIIQPTMTDAGLSEVTSGLNERCKATAVTHVRIR